MKRFQGSFWLWTLAGLCLALAFQAIELSWLIFPGLLLLLYALDLSPSHQSAFYGVWWAGTLKTAGALVWVWSILPLTWIPLETSPLLVFVLALYWLSAAAVISLGFALVARQYKKWSTTHPYAIYLLPALWALGEMAGSFLFSLLTWGTGSVPNIYFSYGYIGYTIAPYQIFFPTAALAGVYGLSFILVLLSSTTYTLLQRKEKRSGFGLLTVLIVVLGSSWLLYQPDTVNQNSSVAAISTQFPLTERVDAERYPVLIENTHTAVSAALSYQPDYILMPEHSDWSSRFEDNSAALRFLTEATSKPITLIDSAKHVTEEGRKQVRATVYNTATEAINYQAKDYLVPHGEYVPILHILLLYLFADEKTFAYFNFKQNYQRGLDIPTADNLPLLFCFSNTNPLAAKHLSQSHSDIIFHLTAHDWFGSPENLRYQQDMMLRVQALWSNKMIVSASNQGPSRSYQPDGNITTNEPVVSGKNWSVRLY